MKSEYEFWCDKCGYSKFRVLDDRDYSIPNCPNCYPIMALKKRHIKHLPSLGLSKWRQNLSDEAKRYYGFDEYAKKEPIYKVGDRLELGNKRCLYILKVGLIDVEVKEVEVIEGNIELGSKEYDNMVRTYLIDFNRNHLKRVSFFELREGMILYYKKEPDIVYEVKELIFQEWKIICNKLKLETKQYMISDLEKLEDDYCDKVLSRKR